MMLAQSYQPIPLGLIPMPTDLTPVGVAHISAAFRIGFTLAIPFVLASLGYNIALGAINRAMPSLMVAFIGAPAITLGGLLMLAFAGPAILAFWASHAGQVIIGLVACATVAGYTEAFSDLPAGMQLECQCLVR